MHNFLTTPIRFLVFLAFVFGIFYLANTDQSGEITESEVAGSLPELKEIPLSTNGENRGYGNLVFVQPVLSSSHYYSEEIFLNSIRPYFEKAKEAKIIDKKTVFILPEHIGSFLAFHHGNRFVYEAETFEKAIQELRKYKKLESAISDENLKKSFYAHFSEEAAEIYSRIFSKLAQEYSVPIVAGSIILKNPKVINGKIKITEGDLLNASFVFLPDGNVYPNFLEKTILSQWEKEFITPGSIYKDKLIVLPSWKLGVLISMESFYPISYSSIRGRAVDSLVSINAISKQNFFPENFEGISTSDPNSSLELLKTKGISEKVSLSSSPNFGEVFLRGKFWNLEWMGESFTKRNLKDVDETNDKDRARLLNLYF